jgi:hypothetical protein
MKYGHKPLTRVIASIGAAAAIALAAPSASAQTTTPPPDSTTTTTTSMATKKPPTTATPQMIQEACQRQKARTARLLQFGIPEEFGSEEPFKFDNKAPPC